jgi:DNA-binding response OmpR family regulator
MTKILVVDDEQKIREIVKKYAEFEGYEVAEAANGIEAINKTKDEDFDIIIMDVMMPELDGFSACRVIRKTKNTPIIMLSARGEEYDKINGFELGVDDYVVKPFSPKELMLRIAAVLKRGVAAATPDADIYSFDGLEINYTARIVTTDGTCAELTPKEYELLCYLVANKGRALTRETLISKVWGYDFFGDDRTLDTHIKLLRKDIGRHGKLIVTLRGVGYRFDEIAV